MSPLSSLFQSQPLPPLHTHPPGVNISLEPSMFDDYHYQYHNHRYPTSSSTASSSSSSNLSCKLSLKGFHVIRRAATNNNNNNNNNNKSSSHTAAAVADFAHLLDPAYHSPKQLAAFMSSNQVYVDTAGETHDPDFRLFAPSATHSPKRREFLTVLPSSPSNMYGGDDEVEEVEEDCFWGEEERYYNRSQQPRSSFDSYRSPSRASDPIYTYSNYRHFDQSYAYRPAMTTNEWQEEQQQQQQPADVFYLEEEEVAEERQPRSQFRSFRRESNKLRRKRAGSESSLEQQQRRRQRDEMMFLEEEGEKGVVLDVGDDDECVRDDEREEKGRQTRSMSPLSGSTTHSFRRQWLALRLRTQFAAFRARRKMTKLVKCATAAA